METKEQREARELRTWAKKKLTSFDNIPSGDKMFGDIMSTLDETLNIWTVATGKPKAYTKHKHWKKVMKLYKMLKGNAKRIVGRILNRIQTNGIGYVIPKSDMALNKIKNGE